MSYPIEAKWTLTRDVWMTGCRMSLKKGFPPVLRVLLPLLYLVLLSVGLWEAVRFGNSFLLIVALVTTVFLVLWRTVLLPRRWLEILKSSPMEGSEVCWLFDEQEIKTVHTMGRSELRWEIFQDAGVFKDGVVFSQQKNMHYWIPAAAFASSEEFSQFVALVKAKVPKTKEIR